MGDKDSKKNQLIGGVVSETRARNKTIMLTPELADEMRTQLSGENKKAGTTELFDAELLAKVRNQIRKQSQNVASKAEELVAVDVSEEDLEIILDDQEEEDDVMILESDLDEEEDIQVSDELELGTVEEPEIYAESKAKDEDPIFPEDADLSLGDVDNDFGVVTEQKREVSPLSDFIEENDVEDLADAEDEEEILIEEEEKMGIEDFNLNQVNGDEISWEKKTKIIGFLLSFNDDEAGVPFELRLGRLIVSDEKPSKGNFLVINDESVSSMHAIIKVSEKGVIVLDQLSEGGTSIQRGDNEIELSGDKSDLVHGDILSFGERSFQVFLQ